MANLYHFHLLKQEILKSYRAAYPFYKGSFREFGNKEIAQLLDLVENDCNERVSEKWVYTHLKPAENLRLPRKDMLDIFSRWTGYKDWDEFVFRNEKTGSLPPEIKPGNKKNYLKLLFMGISALIILSVFIARLTSAGHEVTVCFKDKYTRKTIETDKFSLYILEKGHRKKVNVGANCPVIDTKEQQTILLVESPYYKADTITVDTGVAANLEFDLQPDDYAMMLRAYMNSDLDDWNKRKKQLEGIISEDAVIQEIMFDEIGVEFLNKEEFISKITTPSKAVKKMEIVEIKYEGNKIISLKFIQK